MDREEVGVVPLNNTHHVGIIGCISPNYTVLLSLPSVELFGFKLRHRRPRQLREPKRASEGSERRHRTIKIEIAGYRS
jgi:hypothetical protein